MQSNVNSTEETPPRDPNAGGFVLTNPEAEPHEPQSVGELLGAGRGLAGLSIADVANRLRMSVKQIDALERGDYSAIPSGTFLRGFVRNYAKAVGVDIETALRVLERTHTDALAVAASPIVAPATLAAPPTFEMRGDALATPKSRAVIALLLVVCLAAVVWYWWQFIRPHRADGGRPAEKEVVVQPAVLPALPVANAALGSAGESTAAQEQPPVAGKVEAGSTSGKPANAERVPVVPLTEAAGAAPVAPTSNPAPGRQQPVPAAITLSQPPTIAEKSLGVAAANEKEAKSKRAGETGVIGFTFSAESWVEVTDGTGRTIISRRYKPGEADEVTGRGPFSIVVGNAQSTRMAYNGREFDLAPHTKATVARVTVK
jgi:cytoskeleton protein RodZ